MAVADAAMKPSPPPPPRIIVAALLFVRLVLALTLALLRVTALLFVRLVLAPTLALVRVAAPTLGYPGFAVVWVLCAASAAKVVVGRAWGEISAPFVFLQALTDAALKVSFYIVLLLLALAAVLLCELCLVYVIAVVSGFGSEFKKVALEAIIGESTQELFKFPRAVVLGLFADLASILLIVAGILVVMTSSPVVGSISQGEIIGSVITDVGIFGLHAIACFVIIPTLALASWSDDQSDRKA